MLVRAGHTEGIVDLCTLAGFKPAARRLRNHRAKTARWCAGRSSKQFCQEHGLKMCTIADLISYRLKREQFVKRIETITLPTQLGRVQAARVSKRRRSAAAPGAVQGRRGRSRREGQSRSCTKSRCSCACTANA